MIETRRLGAGDEAEVFQTGHLFDGLEPSAIAEFLNSPSDHLLLAYLDGEAVGSLIAHELLRLDGPPEMLLYEIGTDERFQRRGVARALIEALKTLARKRGCRGIFVPTNASNFPAMALYESTGGKREAQDDVIFVYDL